MSMYLLIHLFILYMPDVGISAITSDPIKSAGGTPRNDFPICLQRCKGSRCRMHLHHILFCGGTGGTHKIKAFQHCPALDSSNVNEDYKWTNIIWGYSPIKLIKWWIQEKRKTHKSLNQSVSSRQLLTRTVATTADRTPGNHWTILPHRSEGHRSRVDLFHIQQLALNCLTASREPVIPKNPINHGKYHRMSVIQRCADSNEFQR